MRDLKNAIKENFLKIDLGVLDNGGFDPCCLGCTVYCVQACAIGCATSRVFIIILPNPPF